MSILRDPVPPFHTLPPRAQWCDAARKLRDTYAIVPGAPLYRREFGFFGLDRWYAEGLDRQANLEETFYFDEPALLRLEQLGWCEAAFAPDFEVKLLEQRGDHELEQDHAGRQVLYFKDRRDGYMPEYVGHPVRDWQTWEENVKWRLDPATGARYDDLEERMKDARAWAAQGKMLCQNLIGGYMYLRSLIGPSELLMMFCEQPALIHDCMETWFNLADAVIARHQHYITLDEVFFAEDICYNRSSLISPAMMHEFLLPYYKQLIANIRRRQRDPDRRLYIQIDTDGFADVVIPAYLDIGMDVMSPFEVAAGCDVVRTGREYPGLVLFGGIDKRVLASTREDIERHVRAILPAMRERGGYIPTCDHGVPQEVSLDNYRYYRDLCVELGG